MGNISDTTQKTVDLVGRTNELVRKLRELAASTGVDATGAADGLPDEIADGFAEQLASANERIDSLNEQIYVLGGVLTDHLQRIEAIEEMNLQEVNDAQDERIAHLEEEIVQLRFDTTVKPELRARLTAMGYTDEEAEGVIAMYSRDEVEGKIVLREGLYGLDYTTREIEECMEDVPYLKQADIDHAMEIKEAWNPETTQLHMGSVNFCDDTKLIVFPKIDFSNVKTINQNTLGAAIAYMPLLDTSALTRADAPWLSNKQPYMNTMKRLPQFDFSSYTGGNGGLTGYLYNVESMPPLSFPSATNLNSLVKNDTKLKELPPIEFGDTVTNIQQAFAGTSFEHLPFGGDFKQVKDFSLAFASCWQGVAGGKDLSGERLKSTAPSVILGSMFQGASIKEMPEFDFVDISDMSRLFVYALRTPKVIPDLTKWENVKLWNWFLWPDVGPERVEGLNFASASEDETMPFTQTNPRGLDNLRYVRIINLGKGKSANYSFYPIPSWGLNNADHPDALQSLVDTLLTDSYDRAAAGMPTAKVTLNPEVLSRLTEEQKAAITAKGFTLASRDW